MISVKTRSSRRICPTDDPAAPGYMILLVRMFGYDPFWRRLRFPTCFMLSHLHQAIQDITQFEGYHLHQFVDENDHLYAPEFDEETWFSPPDPSRCHLEQRTAAGAVLRKKGDILQYEYDFGDNWKFPITLENREPFPEGEKPRITCMGGGKAGPLEDCGGITGFMEMLEAFDKPEPSDAEMEILEWAGADYDPDRFDIEAANRKLARIKGPRGASSKRKRKSPGEAPPGE